MTAFINVLIVLIYIQVYVRGWEGSNSKWLTTFYLYRQDLFMQFATRILTKTHLPIRFINLFNNNISSIVEKCHIFLLLT